MRISNHLLAVLGLFLCFHCSFLTGCGAGRDPIAPPIAFAALTIESTKILSAPPSYGYDGQIAVGPTGEIFCCWMRQFAGIPEVVWRHGMPGSLSDEEPITEVDGYRSWNPSIVAGPDRAVHFAWMDQMIDGRQKEVYARTWRDGEWGPAVLLSLEDGWTGWDPDVGVFPDGRPVVVWFDHRYNVQHEIILRVGDGQGSWQPDIRMTNDTVWQFFPDMDIDSDATVHLSYVDTRHKLDEWEDTDEYPEEGNLEIYYRTWDGTDIGNEVRISNTPLRSIASQIAVDGMDRVHVVWLDESARGWWVLYYSAIESGSAGGMIPVSNVNRRADLSAIACLGSRIFTACSEYQDPEGSSLSQSSIYLREILPGRGVGTPLKLSSGGTNVHPRMVADPSRDMLWVIWMEYIGDDETFITGASRIHLCGVRVKD